VKNQNGELLADSHNILSKLKNYYSQLLNMHNISNVRQIDLHIAQPLLSGPSRLEVEIAIANLKKFKSPRTDQISAELFAAGGEILLMRSTNSLILFGTWKNYLISGKSLLLYQFRKGQ
jgi:hypothetical protein